MRIEGHWCFCSCKDLTAVSSGRQGRRIPALWTVPTIIGQILGIQLLPSSISCHQHPGLTVAPMFPPSHTSSSHNLTDHPLLRRLGIFCCFNQHHQIPRFKAEGTHPTWCTFYTFWIPTPLQILQICGIPNSHLELAANTISSSIILTYTWLLECILPSLTRPFSLAIIGNNNSSQGGGWWRCKQSATMRNLFGGKFWRPQPRPLFFAAVSGRWHYVRLTRANLNLLATVSRSTLLTSYPSCLFLYMKIWREWWETTFGLTSGDRWCN